MECFFSELFFGSNILIALLSIFFSIKIENKASLNISFNIFIIIFFSLVPYVQMKYNTSFFGAEALSCLDNFITSTYILVSLIFYNGMYFSKRRFFKSKVTSNIKTNSFSDNHLIIISLISGLLFLFLIKFNFSILFIRPIMAYWRYGTYGGVYGLFLTLIVRPIPIIAFYSSIFNKNKNKNNSVILLIITLVISFPFSLSRGEAVAFYFPLILYLFPFAKKGTYYIISLLSGLFIIFPLLNFFRKGNHSIQFGISLINSAHFDTYYNTANAIKSGIVTNGNQFLSVILFFIPKSVWSNKPLNSGNLVANFYNYNYTNVSMSLWGEGYLNFNVLGIIIFITSIGYLNAFLDEKKLEDGKSKGYNMIFYHFMLAFEFYLLRGELRGAIRKICFFLVAMLIVKFSSNLLQKLFVKKNT